MTVKVTYDVKTTLVTGYYPDLIKYRSIPEPWIEITDEEYKKFLGKKMCVINNIYKEYTKPLEQRIQNAKELKILQLVSNRIDRAENSTITYNNKTYSNSQNARIAINYFINKLSPQESTKYFTYPEKEIVELYRTDFQKIATMIEGNEMYLREKEMQLIKEINNCKSLTALNKININLTQQQNDNSN